MKQPKPRPRVYLAFPGYGPEANLAATKAVIKDHTDGRRFDVTGQSSMKSLLANNFNTHYCNALNDPGVTHFAMLHTDIGPQEWWLDRLYGELIGSGADLVSVVVPLKDERGNTSVAIGVEDTFWGRRRRLTLKEIWRMPETFSIDDCIKAGLAEPGDHLLVNTGCWICDLRRPWCRQLNPQRPGTPGPALRCFFTIADAIFQLADGQFCPGVVPEDWMFSRMLAESGARVLATRKVRLRHFGHKAYDNYSPWARKRTPGTSTSIKETLMAKKTQAGMGLEPQVEPPDDTNPPADPVCAPAPATCGTPPLSCGSEPATCAPRQANRPWCPRHQIQMVAYSTNSTFTYYRCPEGAERKLNGTYEWPAGSCRETDKRRRPVGPQKNLYGFGTSAPGAAAP